MRHAIRIILTDEETGVLNRTVRAKTSTQREVARARVILQAGAGKENQEIASEVGLCSHSVAVWRNRFAAERLKGLVNRPRKRTPIKYTAEDRRRVVEMACSGSPVCFLTNEKRPTASIPVGAPRRQQVGEAERERDAANLPAAKIERRQTATVLWPWLLGVLLQTKPELGRRRRSSR